MFFWFFSFLKEKEWRKAEHRLNNDDLLGVISACGFAAACKGIDIAGEDVQAGEGIIRQLRAAGYNGDAAFPADAGERRQSVFTVAKNMRVEAAVCVRFAGQI